MFFFLAPNFEIDPTISEAGQVYIHILGSSRLVKKHLPFGTFTGCISWHHFGRSRYASLVF